MGEARTRADAEKVRLSQNWNLKLTAGERFELRTILLQRHTADDVMDRNNEAIEALEGSDRFDMPRGMSLDDQQAWLKGFNLWLDKPDRTWHPLTIENVLAILDGIAWCAKNGFVTNPKGEKILLMDGARSYRIRHAKKRLKAAKDDSPICGESEPAKVEVPASVPTLVPTLVPAAD